ncbi:methyl-accepting chemotaxis protein [Cohnella silvisoli]|uniref:Methyl-accepting chemotaxis protein n=1 Tax=Cohnella silvisoli TaxID=2873699 RepID=A0ABV1KQ60_9BACL|nr:methyl-accepting chemotaxis protein [Cohnella silvisoli]MCD9022231.1 methyl-accepting chemotaxis protein [Cohnella silvisoli]
MKICIKLLIAFAAMIVLLLILGLYTFNQTKLTRAAHQEMLRDAEFRFDLKSVQFQLAGMSNDERAFILNGDPQFKSEIAKKDAQMRDLLSAIKSNPTLDSSDLETMARAEEEYEKYFKVSQQVLSFIGRGKASEAETLHFSNEREARKNLNAVIDPLLEKLVTEMNQDLLDRQAENNRHNMTMLVIFAISVIIAIIIGLLLARSITRPLRQVEVQIREIAEGHGDLSREIILSSKDEIAELAHSFNRMVRNLRSILSQAQDTAIQVAASSEQLTASAEQTTLATEQIVAATQLITVSAEKEQQHVAEAVAAVQQMSAGIGQVSASNEEVFRLAHSASDASTQGIHAVQDVLQGMKEIQETVRHAASAIQSLGDRSQQIGGITNIITDIAYRTNLLSLNAGIEAARAGEHGKGFAVVAQEIRKLAEQSKESTLQISELIEGILIETQKAVTAMHNGTEKVNLGLSRAELADEVFHTIGTNVSAVNSQLEQTATTTTQLAASSKQIVAMVEGVSAASNEVAASCQSNSASTEEQLATMEEISSSSQALSKLAEDLHNVLSGFKLH